VPRRLTQLPVEDITIHRGPICGYARLYVTPPKQALAVSGMFWDLLQLTENRLRRDLNNSHNPAQAAQGII
jgi:hypothetical protein